MAEDAFESDLKKVEHFYSTDPISRTHTHLNQMFVDGEVVFLDM